MSNYSRTIEQREQLMNNIIADSGTMMVKEIAAKYRISESAVQTYRSKYRKLHGSLPAQLQRTGRGGGFSRGFCLMCKKLSKNPDDTVPMYRGNKNCPACKGTGYYLPSIMLSDRVKVSSLARNLCVDYPKYNKYLDACDKRNIEPASKAVWKNVRCERKEQK